MGSLQLAMTERCLIAASLAALAFHPSSTIRCFKPKPEPAAFPVQQEEETDPIWKLHRRSLRKVLCMTKSWPGKQASVSRRRTASTVCSASVGPCPSLDPVSEPLAGVVEAIFRSGWGKGIGVTVEKILKVNHSRDAIESFEEYRQMVKSKAKKEERVRSTVRYWERLVGDGNEHLMYDGGVIGCSLGWDEGDLSVCREKWCGVCRVISSSNSVEREGEAVLMWGSSWGAHEKVGNAAAAANPPPRSSPAARRGIVLCKVIAGRVVGAHRLMVGGGEKGGGFDSVVRTGGDHPVQELRVLNPKAILPCYVIIYSTYLHH